MIGRLLGRSVGRLLGDWPWDETPPVVEESRYGTGAGRKRPLDESIERMKRTLFAKKMRDLREQEEAVAVMLLLMEGEQ